MSDRPRRNPNVNTFYARNTEPTPHCSRSTETPNVTVNTEPGSRPSGTRNQPSGTRNQPSGTRNQPNVPDTPIDAPRKNGFDRGLSPEKIVAGIKQPGMDLQFMVKFKGTDRLEKLPAKLCNRKCPQLVINFYHEKTEFGDILL